HHLAAEPMEGRVAELAAWRRGNQAEQGTSPSHDRMNSTEESRPFFIDSHFRLHRIRLINIVVSNRSDHDLQADRGTGASHPNDTLANMACSLRPATAGICFEGKKK